MAVNVINVQVDSNPSPFFSNILFEVTFDCVSQLSGDDPSCDQELETVLVGPVNVGTSKFVLETPPPNPNSIPAADLLGVTVVMLTCAYNSQEFIRVGYYVNNELPGLGEEDPVPDPIDPHQIQRSILADKPRVTHFAITWDE